MTAQVDALIETYVEYKESATEIREIAVRTARVETANVYLKEIGEMNNYIGSITDAEK